MYKENAGYVDQDNAVLGFSYWCAKSRCNLKSFWSRVDTRTCYYMPVVKNCEREESV